MLRSLAVALSLAFLALPGRALADIHATAGTGAGAPAPATSEPAAPPAEPATPATPPKKPTKVEAPTAVAVLVAYQRVGHDLLALQDQRGVHDCGDLMPRFRAIKLADALATPASRTTAAATLTELGAQIERYRGIHVEQACLDNPLAAGCQ